MADCGYLLYIIMYVVMLYILAGLQGEHQGSDISE